MLGPALQAFRRRWSKWANTKWEETCGVLPSHCPPAMTMQWNILVMTLLESFKPGSEEGMNAIHQMYMQAMNDTMNRWNSEQLRRCVS